MFGLLPPPSSSLTNINTISTSSSQPSLLSAPYSTAAPAFTFPTALVEPALLSSFPLARQEAVLGKYIVLDLVDQRSKGAAAAVNIVTGPRAIQVYLCVCVWLPPSLFLFFILFSFSLLCLLRLVF